MIIADTSGLLVLFNSNEPDHSRVADWVASSPDVIVVSPFVVAELDYLVATRFGVDAEASMLTELFGGAYELPGLDETDLRSCAEVVARYRDQGIGVADASLAVLARRYKTRTVLTLDRRHFEVLRPLDGGRFKLVPG